LRFADISDPPLGENTAVDERSTRTVIGWGWFVSDVPSSQSKPLHDRWRRQGATPRCGDPELDTGKRQIDRQLGYRLPAYQIAKGHHGRDLCSESRLGKQPSKLQHALDFNTRE
jgi:hypothetical protein